MLGLGLSLWNSALRGGGGPVVYSAEAQQFFARVSDPGATRKALYATMIDSVVVAGVWSKLDILYVFAAADEATALENLKQDLYNATSVNAATFTVDVGFAGNGTDKSIATEFNPSLGGVLYTRDSANLFVWSNKSGTDISGIVGHDSSGSNANIYPRYTDDNIYGRVNEGVDLAVPSTTDGRGLLALSRTGANASKLYKNGAEVAAGVNASSAVVNDTFSFLRERASHFTGQALCGGFGGALSDAEELALYNALHTYLQAVAGVA